MSRAEREWAYTVVDDENVSDIDRALAFHIMATQTPAQNMNRKKTWRLVINPITGTTGRWRSERVAVLAERLWNVQLESRPAAQLLERLSPESHCVIYCDPPYYTADTEAYSIVDLDLNKLTELFHAQVGRLPSVAMDQNGIIWDGKGMRWNAQLI